MAHPRDFCKHQTLFINCDECLAEEAKYRYRLIVDGDTNAPYKATSLLGLFWVVFKCRFAHLIHGYEWVD
jgi:hypothetical protein